MSDIALWKMLLDFCLLLSLAYLGYRISKSEGPGAKLPKLLELERSLKSIISEAQQAGSLLNRELQGRQRDLEKVLFDLETVESRMNRAVTSAEDRKGALELEIGKAKEMIREVANTVSSSVSGGISNRTPQVVGEQQSLNSVRDGIVELRTKVDLFDLAPEPPSFVAKVASEGEKPVAIAAKGVAKTNIYGEPIVEPERVKRSGTVQNGKKALSKRIEVTEQNPYSRQEVLKSRLEDIYYAAETMLRAGGDIDSVASRTKLPLDEVRMLEQMVSREKVLQQTVEAPPAVDPRLGVLAQAGRSADSAK